MVWFPGHGKRESNTLVIYPKDENNPEKSGIILDIMHCRLTMHQSSGALGEAYGLSASWWGNGLPRRRRIAGVRA